MTTTASEEMLGYRNHIVDQYRSFLEREGMFMWRHHAGRDDIVTQPCGSDRTFTFTIRNLCVDVAITNGEVSATYRYNRHGVTQPTLHHIRKHLNQMSECEAGVVESEDDRRSKLREFFRGVQAVYMEAAGRPPSQPGINEDVYEWGGIHTTKVVISADHSAGMVRVTVGDDVRNSCNYVPSDGAVSYALARGNLLGAGYVQGGVLLKDQMERERRAATLDMSPDEEVPPVRPTFRLQVMEEYTQAGLYDVHINHTPFFRSGGEYVSVDIGRHSRRHFPGQPFDRAATIEHIRLARGDAEPKTITNVPSWFGSDAPNEFDHTGHIFSAPVMVGSKSHVADVLGKMGRRAARETHAIREVDAEAMRKTLVGLGLKETAADRVAEIAAYAQQPMSRAALAEVLMYRESGLPSLVVDLSGEMPDKIDAQERASGCDAREGKLAWTYRKTAELEARFSATIRNTLREWPTHQGQPMTIHTHVDQGVFVLTLKAAA